tara:strand:+ start:180 stop:428 length:249 start_codon:yes stop_codon:yes gene_type:complete
MRQVFLFHTRSKLWVHSIASCGGSAFLKRDSEPLAWDEDRAKFAICGLEDIEIKTESQMKAIVKKKKEDEAYVDFVMGLNGG